MSVVPSFIPNSGAINSKINNFFGSDSIDVIRNVDWDVNYLWTVDFVDAVPPAPFDKFFPASDVTIPMGILEMDSIPFGQTDIQIPVRTKSKELSITFYDDSKRTLLNYMKDWIELDILNKGQFVSGLKDSHKVVVPRTVPISSGNNVQPIRRINLLLLDKYKKTVQSFKYGIVPTGQIDYTGSQASEAQTYTMTFVIVEDLELKVAKTTMNFADIGKDLLGRFL